MDAKFIEKLVNFIDEIEKEYKVKFAYLFGSFARGEENEQSDIDIALYFKENYSSFEDVMIRGNIIEQGKANFKKDIDIVSLNKAPLRLQYEVIKEGQVLKEDFDRPSFESKILREYYDYAYYAERYNRKIIESIKDDKYFGGE